MSHLRRDRWMEMKKALSLVISKFSLFITVYGVHFNGIFLSQLRQIEDDK